MSEIDNILNVMRLTDRLISSGQPLRHQFQSIADAGFDIIINLAMPDSDNAIADEGDIVTALQMLYFDIPVPFDAPAPEHFQAFSDIMQKYNNRCIWVHCAFNYRVSAFMYLYRHLITGQPASIARNCMLPSWDPDPVWHRFIQTLITRHNAKAKSCIADL